MANVEMTCSMNEKFSISEERIDEIMEELSKVIDTTITSEELLPKLETLHNAAKDFQEKYSSLKDDLNDIKQKYKHVKEIEKAQEQLKGEEKDKLQSEIDAYNTEIESIKSLLLTTPEGSNGRSLAEALYSSVFQFQTALNDFLNQKMILTIVFKDKIYTVEESDYSQFLNYSINKEEGKIKGRFSNLQNIITQLEASEWTDPNFLTSQKYILDSVNRVTYGYRSATDRYNKAQSHIKEDRGETPHWSLILWHRPNWKRAWVLNRGDLGEAYASILLNRELTNSYLSNDIDTILDSFMNEVFNVDSISGVLKGDYSAEGLEYAIKCIDASALGYAQFNEIANEIFQSNYSPAAIKEWSDKQIEKGRKRNHFIEDINSVVSEDLLHTIESTIP